MRAVLAPRIPMEVRTIEVGAEQPAEPLELCCLPFELQLLCASHVRDGRDLAALRAAASWATALVDGAVSPLTLFAWHLRARRARASARTVHAPRGKPRFIVLRTAHALRLVGGMQTPGLCCGHRQRPMHELTLALNPNPNQVAKTQKHCWSCSAAQPKMKRDGLTIQAEYSERTDENDQQKMELTAERAHRILKAISDEDCRKLGFDPQYARPDWMVLTVRRVLG